MPAFCTNGFCMNPPVTGTQLCATCTASSASAPSPCYGPKCHNMARSGSRYCGKWCENQAKPRSDRAVAVAAGEAWGVKLLPSGAWVGQTPGCGVTRSQALTFSCEHDARTWSAASMSGRWHVVEKI